MCVRMVSCDGLESHAASIFLPFPAQALDPLQTQPAWRNYLIKNKIYIIEWISNEWMTLDTKSHRTSYIPYEILFLPRKQKKKICEYYNLTSASESGKRNSGCLGLLSFIYCESMDQVKPSLFDRLYMVLCSSSLLHILYVTVLFICWKRNKPVLLLFSFSDWCVNNFIVYFDCVCAAAIHVLIMRSVCANWLFTQVLLFN